MMSTEDLPTPDVVEPKKGLLARLWAYKWRTAVGITVIGILGAWVQAQPAAKEQRWFNHFLELGLRHDRIVDATSAGNPGREVLTYQYVENRILLCRREGQTMKTLVVTADAQRRVIRPDRKPSGAFDTCQDIFTLYAKPWMEAEMQPPEAPEATPEDAL